MKSSSFALIFLMEQLEIRIGVEIKNLYEIKVIWRVDD